jgi:hypothetical protein
MTATAALNKYRNRKGTKPDKQRIKEMQADVDKKRKAMDNCNRFSIAIRGASADTYGILKAAKISEGFAALLLSIAPSSTSQDTMLQHMRPFGELADSSCHSDWMSDYPVTRSWDQDDEM